LIQLKDEGILLPSDVENRIPRPIFQLHDLLHKIVSDNGIIRREEDDTKEKIKLILKTTMKLQGMLVN
jgi:hypothetical protein